MNITNALYEAYKNIGEVKSVTSPPKMEVDYSFPPGMVYIPPGQEPISGRDIGDFSRPPLSCGYIYNCPYCGTENVEPEKAADGSPICPRCHGWL